MKRILVLLLSLYISKTVFSQVADTAVIEYKEKANDTLAYRNFKFVDTSFEIVDDQVDRTIIYQFHFPVFYGAKKAIELNGLMVEAIFFENILKAYFKDKNKERRIDSNICLLDIDSIKYKYRNYPMLYLIRWDGLLFDSIKVDIEKFEQILKGKVVFNKNNLISINTIFYQFEDGVDRFNSNIWYNYYGENNRQILNAFELVEEEDSVNLLKRGKELFREKASLPPNKLISFSEYFYNDSFYLTSNFGITENGLVFYYQRFELVYSIQSIVEFTIPWSEVKLKKEYAWLSKSE